MFVLSVAALVVYWGYIRQNMPLDFYLPSASNSENEISQPNTDAAATASDDGNNNAYIASQSDSLHCHTGQSETSLSSSSTRQSSVDLTSLKYIIHI